MQDKIFCFHRCCTDFVIRCGLSTLYFEVMCEGKHLIRLPVLCCRSGPAFHCEALKNESVQNSQTRHVIKQLAPLLLLFGVKDSPSVWRSLYCWYKYDLVAMSWFNALYSEQAQEGSVCHCYSGGTTAPPPSCLLSVGNAMPTCCHGACWCFWLHRGPSFNVCVCDRLTGIKEGDNNCCCCLCSLPTAVSYSG